MMCSLTAEEKNSRKHGVVLAVLRRRPWKPRQAFRDKAEISPLRVGPGLTVQIQAETHVITTVTCYYVFQVVKLAYKINKHSHKVTSVV